MQLDDFLYDRHAQPGTGDSAPGIDAIKALANSGQVFRRHANSAIRYADDYVASTFTFFG